MEPVYFGKNESLFGFYHPAGQGVATGAVVICPPLFNEYYRSYPIQKELAFRLADLGYDVLRFDYRGTGDSGNALEEVSLDNWREDIRYAFSEIQELSGESRVVMVGVRYAAIMSMDALKELEPSGMVFWDPVLDGESYIRGLKLIEQDVAKEYWNSHERIPPRGEQELVGYEVHPELVDELSALSYESLSEDSSRKWPLMFLLSQNFSLDSPPGVPIEMVEFSCEWNNSAGPILFAKTLIDSLSDAVQRVFR